MQSISLTSRFIYTWIILFLIWYAFTTSLAPAELITGGVVSFILSIFTFKIFSCCGLKIFMPHKFIYVIQYIFVFIIALIKSNLDVARRVISPSLPINPGIVEFETKLTNDFAKMVLANSITLTPGTLTVDVIDNKYYIHWIDVVSDKQEIAFKEIAEDFEKVLLKIFK